MGDPNHFVPGMILQYMFQKYEPKERAENTIRFFWIVFFFSLGFFEKKIWSNVAKRGIFSKIQRVKRRWVKASKVFFFFCEDG